MALTLLQKWQDTRKDFADQVKEDAGFDSVKILALSARKVDEWLDKLDKAKANGSAADFAKAKKQAGEAVASYKGILDKHQKIVNANLAHLRSKKWKLALPMLQNGLKLVTKEAASLTPPVELPVVTEKSSITSAETKKPPFDPKWWLKKKSPKADRDDAFAKALAVYALAKSKIGVKALESVTRELQQAAAEVKATAEKARKDPGLNAVFQKETLATLASYVKISDAAIAWLASVEKHPELTAMIPALVRTSDQFRKFCIVAQITESYAFLRTMYASRAMNQDIYDRFISQQGPATVNLPATIAGEFTAMRDAFQRTDDPKSWDNPKLVQRAVKEIEQMLENERLDEFRTWLRASFLKNHALP